MVHVLFCPLCGSVLQGGRVGYDCPSHGSLVDVSMAFDGGHTKFSFSYPQGYQTFTSVDFETNKNQEFAVEEKNEDVITKPGHYNQYTGFEVMDVCRQIVSPDATPASTWFRGNVFKYLARAGWKNAAKELEDLNKAQEYLRLEIERVTKREELMADSLEEIVDEVMKDAPYSTPWGRDYDPKADKTYRCPVCETVLEPVSPKPKVVMKCFNDHGWMSFPEGRREGLWLSQPAQEAQRECPICETKFGANSVCPQGHGYFLDDQFWMADPKRDEQVLEQKLLDSIDFCPRCGGALGQLKLPRLVMEKYCLRKADSVIRVIDGRLAIKTINNIHFT